MDNAKVKNYILIVLALVNVFLLAIVLTNARQAARAAAARQQALEAVLSDNGIRLADTVSLRQSVPPQLTLRRELSREKDMVKALLGEADVTDLGGNVYSYKGKNGGEAKFRGTGEFTFLLPDGSVARGRDAVQTAKSILSRLGLRCSDAEPAVNQSGSSTALTFTCAWRDTPVFNARVSFYFNAASLCLITGTRPFDTQYSSTSADSAADSVTVLTNFLQSLRSTGDVCREIRGLDIGYFAVSAVSGDCTLHPVWCVQTDSHAYYIDAETGKSETLEAVG